MNIIDKIAAGIVLYNPDLVRLRENIESIYQQVNMVLLVDNGSINIEEIEQEFNKLENIIFIKNEGNLGIAYALNQLVKYCLRNDYEWVLTLDQDSVVPNDIINSYIKYTGYENVALISPRIIDRNEMIHEEKISKIHTDVDVIKKCITSASLTNVNKCSDIGFFDEKMFIDLVDFDYCKRALNANYTILRINNVIMNHQLGDMEIRNIYTKKIRVTNHSKERVYYYSRNSIYYLNKHRENISKQEIYWDLLKKISKVVFFENDRLNKTIYFLKGLRDGKKNRMGQLNAE